MRIKRWKEMSEREVVELKRNQCMKCVYLSKSSPSSISNATCDYISYCWSFKRLSAYGMRTERNFKAW